LLTVTGTFAVLYASAAPLRRRAVTVAGIGLDPGGPTRSARHRPAGSYFLVLCAGIANLLVREHGTEPALIPAMTAVGVVVAWLVTMCELLPDPRRPERKAVEAARAAVASYVATEPGPDGRPQHRAAAHALAAAEEAMAEGMWRPSRALAAELEAAHDQFTERAARASLHIVPGEETAWDPRNPDAGRWLTGDPGGADVEMPTGESAERVEHALAEDERQTIGSLRRRLVDGLRW